MTTLAQKREPSLRRRQPSSSKRPRLGHNGAVPGEVILLQRILVPLHGSATSRRGLGGAIGLAAEQKARLLVLHVVDDFTSVIEVPSAQLYDEMVRKLRQSGLD